MAWKRHTDSLILQRDYLLALHDSKPKVDGTAFLERNNG